MPSALAFAVVILAAYRTARFIPQDSLFVEVRRTLFHWAWTEVPLGDPEPRSSLRSYVYGLLTCSLCSGVWIAALYYVAWVNWSWSHSPLIVLAIAGGQAFLAQRDPDEAP